MAIDFSKASGFTAYLPTEGLFRSSDSGGAGGSLYRRAGKKLEEYDITSLLTAEEKAGLKNYGEMSTKAREKLSKMGIDYNSLPSQNIADVNMAAAKEGLEVARRAGAEGGSDWYFHKGGELSSLIQQKPLASSGATAFEFNTPQDIETAKVQLGEAKNNQIKNVPTVLSPEEQREYYASEGNKANPLSPLDWLKRKSTPTPTKTNGATTTNPQDEIAKYNSMANEDQKNDYSIISSTLGTNVEVSDSRKLVEALVKSFEGNTEKKPPSLQEEFKKQRTELGVGELETELSKADEDIAKLDADFASTLTEEDQRQVSKIQIGRRQSQVQTNYQRARRDLEVARQGVANRLNQKYAVLDSMVKFAGMDFDNAQQDYQFKFNAAISLTNLIKGIESTEKSEADKKIDDARANAQIMYNAVQAGNVKWDELDASTKMDVKNMELQAGLPSGFMQFLSRTVKNVTTFLPAFTDANGNRIQPVGTTNADGSFTVKNVNIGTAKAEGADKEIISQATLNKLSVAGVPEVVALDIQRSFNSGIKESVIKAHLVKQLGQETGSAYFDAFKRIMGADGF